MQSQYSNSSNTQAMLTLENVSDAINQLIEWNAAVKSTDYYYGTQSGMQLLAANCTLITAIGEGINRVERILPNFLKENFPDIPWHAIVGMRNHIAHGYFELDADIVFEAVKKDIPPLLDAIEQAISLLKH